MQQSLRLLVVLAVMLHGKFIRYLPRAQSQGPKVIKLEQRGRHRQTSCLRAVTASVRFRVKYSFDGDVCGVSFMARPFG